jgi:hypothetical protein
MVAVILATALCLGIVSCGVNYELMIASRNFQWATGVLTVTAYAESGLMLGSLIGLMIVPVVWLISKLGRAREAGGEGRD